MIEQICTSSKKSRGLAQKTLDLRQAILDAFEETDKPVTVRQMFYMLTVRGAIPKTEEQGYRPVQRQLVLMRREGAIPYNWIADNTRWMRKDTTFASLESFFESAVDFYRQDLWHRLDTYVEVWCEKDALAGVINPITRKWDVPLMVARGYSSESFAYEAAMNIKAHGKQAYIYYVGDFDPSGWQMATNLEQKLKEFCPGICFERLGVNVSQILEWQLPARPSKKTDPRCKGFYEMFGHGTDSVELDALPPDTLRALIEQAIRQHIDIGELERFAREEIAARETLRELAENGLF